MNISALPGQLKAADVPLDKLAANPKLSEQEKSAEACRQFEAILLRQILGEARKNVLAPSASSKSSVTGIYEDMINNQMADSISRSGSFGLAKNLQAQLKHQIFRSGDAAKAAPTPLGAKPLKVSNQP
jgi:peptidoglycan hydrolase FlgJ